jgi:ComF family protein
MVHLLKYRGEFARSPWCAEQMWRAFATDHTFPSIIVPVPLHRSRLKRRGFNQSERIAVEVSKRSGIPHDPALMRWRATVPQVDLDADQRAQNVHGAFVARRMLTGQDVLLIDDVVTTGATLEACARACVEVGASRVRALTLATAT